jgi:hypothetical protein
MTTNTQHQRLVLEALSVSDKPLDAYGVAKRTGLSAMDSGRALFALEALGSAKCLDARGTPNDLACRFQALRTQVAA